MGSRAGEYVVTDLLQVAVVLAVFGEATVGDGCWAEELAGFELDFLPGLDDCWLRLSMAHMLAGIYTLVGMLLPEAASAIEIMRYIHTYASSSLQYIRLLQRSSRCLCR